MARNFVGGIQVNFKTLIVLDQVEKRRAEVYQAMSQITPTIPIASLADLGSSWPESAWFLVSDDDATLSSLFLGFAKRRCFYPIVAYKDEMIPSRVVKAILGGAMNYVIWPSPPEDIAAALNGIEELAMARCARSALRLQAADKLDLLSVREREVIRAMRTGLTSKGIGRALEISHRTVEIHRANAIAKLGAANAMAAIAMLIEAEDGLEPALAA